MENKKKEFLVHPKGFFEEIVNQTLVYRKVSTFPLAKNYLVSLLENYVSTGNLFDITNEGGKLTRETLAEIYLKAQRATPTLKQELLKKLGDVSLYVSGFFADSFQRKIIDVDYYIDMGEVAYGSLSREVKEDTSKKVYSEFSKRFLDFVDVLAAISQKSLIQDNQNILSLYERYLKTGSSVAKDLLEEKGIVTVPYQRDKKTSAQ